MHSKVILASRSPRRKELLKKVFEDFDVVFPDVDENLIEEKDPVVFAVSAAVMKAEKVAAENPDALVVGADTVVALDGIIVGKPSDYDDAFNMLNKLSGSRHKVITGIAVCRQSEKKILTDYELTYVFFNELSEEEIKDYLAQGEYSDKAGAYAIQRENDSFVARIEGDYYNVVGLPVRKLKRLLKRFFLPEIDVEIVDMAFPNRWGVGKKENKVFFVPGTVYGEKIKIRPVKDSKNFSYAEKVSVLERSQFGTAPLCPHFGRCGGCSFQDTAYDKQLELKERYFLSTLKKIGGVDSPEKFLGENIIASPSRFFYRNKMEFAFGRDNGNLVAGLREASLPFRKKRNTIVSLEQCSIFSEKIPGILRAAKDFASSTGLGPYDPYSGKGFFRHLVVREGKNTGDIMVVLVTRSSPDFNVTGFAEALAEAEPGIKSLWWVENDRIADTVSFEKKNHLTGSLWAQERIGRFLFKVYPSTFFQPNTRAAGVVYEIIRQNLAELEASDVLGLYCGSGCLEVFISESVSSVYGADIDAANIHNAVENSRVNGIKNIRFHESSVEDLLKKGLIKGADAIIIDPPRAGMSNKALKNVFSFNPASIIYLSCNPATFARDVQKIVDREYSLYRLYCADFFPHTPHLESLGVFVKNK